MAAINARLPLLLAALLTVVMLATLGWQGYSQWQNDTSAPGDQLALTDTATSAQPRPEQQIKASDVALFGIASIDATNEPLDTENLPETNLRLVLRGVLAADGEFPGSALIEDARAITDVYLVGDELPGNAVLRSVHANRVIINRSGKFENLYFPELTESEGMEFAANDQEEPVDPEPVAEQQTAIPQLTTPEASEQRREEIRQRLEELRERLRSNSN
ncbi:type II secretion system protein N [Marinobacter mobilis]|uniref:Type II secretion system protein C (GspC) n=1 Tax=Marinobacter mobilis TaxID=488533 RepID=A0A1H3BKF2_9GAMM|nr:type II secretion system protein N [Marinobacter mobilis]SDX41804.1 type II secretion system protein C (GspC) [Marinobacter mobilis]